MASRLVDPSERITPVPLQAVRYGGDSLLGPHFGVVTYHFKADAATSLRAVRCTSDEAFWKGVIGRKLKPGMSVSLEGFRCFDWFPRAPGLYYTERAAWSREYALKHIYYDLERPATAASDLTGRDYTLVLTPEGKSSMLDGGVGCIRLKPIMLSGTPHWLLVGTSTGMIHGGVPLAVPKRLYQSWLANGLDDGRGCLQIQGELDFVPDPISHLFMGYSAVPKVYLRVQDFTVVAGPEITPEATVAVSFISEYEGPPRVYASYVTFRPDVAGSFEEATSWMKSAYVEGQYKGQIITDFDQTQTVFPEASLSLQKVMGRLVSRGEVEEVVRLMHVNASIDALLTEVDRKDLLPARRRRERNTVFMSYAHAPERQTRWVERVRTHLGTLGEEAIDAWDDSRIRPGQQWRREIEAAIRRTRVAILVVTADFMASSFIREAELPPLLEAAEADGATILCLYGSEVHLTGIGAKLLKYQWLNQPEEPLQKLSASRRETVFRRLAKRVEEILAEST